MKRPLPILVTLMLILVTFSAFAETPAPFERAKELAKTVAADEDGDYWKDINDVCAVAYFPSTKIIAVIKTDNNVLTAYRYQEDTDAFSKFTSNGMFWSISPIERDEAIKKANTILSEALDEKQT